MLTLQLFHVEALQPRKSKKKKQFYQDLEENQESTISQSSYFYFEIWMLRLELTLSSIATLWEKKNCSGQMLFDLGHATNLVIGNTSFRKRRGKLMTHRSSANGTESQLDYILIWRKWWGCLQDVVTYNSLSSLGSDHRVVVAIIKLRLRANLKQSRKARNYWTTLSQETDLQAR